jgi:hypothetical protein
MAKFKVLSKVHCFNFGGRRYLPGEIVEASEEDAAGFNLDFLERAREPVEVSIVDVAAAAAELGSTVEVDAVIMHPDMEKKVKPKKLPKVPE